MLFVLTASVLLAPPLGQGQGGGAVNNKLPTVEAFTNLGTAANDGSTDTLTGTVRDLNGEVDILSIQVATTATPAGIAAVLSQRTITGSDVSTTTEPLSFDATGWKVWNPGAPRDGVLSFKFQYTYAAGVAGTYTWRASVKDEGLYQTGPATDITVTVVVRVTVAPDPVQTDGTSAAGARWGGWSADPGAVDVVGLNYLKVTNTGATPTQGFVLDFTSSAFTGVTDATESIPIDGNIRFAGCEDTTPATTAPSECTFTYGATSATGSASFSFTATSNIYYVSYRLVAIPSPLLDQNYQASFTVGAV